MFSCKCNGNANMSLAQLTHVYSCGQEVSGFYKRDPKLCRISNLEKKEKEKIKNFVHTCENIGSCE